MIVMDAFAVPVEGTETRVNAVNEGYEYMVEYQTKSRDTGRLENIIGWYHSHPGYGCWLSGIDVNTQKLNQSFQDPFLAVVIDPNRTVAAGRVEIGAFRTYPENYIPPNATSEYQTIPLDKIEDFGAHANRHTHTSTLLTSVTTNSTFPTLNQVWTKRFSILSGINTGLKLSLLLLSYQYTLSTLLTLELRLQCKTSL
jgi:COP9 signalosome complex subunit 5